MTFFAIAASAPAASPVAIGPVTGAFFGNPTNSGAFDATQLSSELFHEQFPVIDFNPPSGAQVNCSNTTGVNENTRPFTDVVPNLDGSCSNVVAEGGGQQAGVGSLGAFEGVFSANLTVTSPGQVTFNFFSDDGWMLGVGPQAGGTTQPTYVSGSLINAPKTSPLHKYRVVGAYNTNTSPVQAQVTVEFPNAGTYPIEVDYTECCGGQLALTLGTTLGNPIPPPSGRWEPLGPTQVEYAGHGRGQGGDNAFNGRVTAIAVDAPDPAHGYAGDPEHVYIGTLGGVFSSTDGAGTWSSPGRNSPGAVSALAVGGSQRVYAGTGLGAPGTGVYVSEDSGASWARSKSLDAKSGKAEFANNTIHSLIVKEADLGKANRSEQTLYAAADGGVYESGNGGETWTLLKAAAIAGSVVQDPEEGNSFWAAYTYKRTDRTSPCEGSVGTLFRPTRRWTTGLTFKSTALPAGLSGNCPVGADELRIALTVIGHHHAWAAVVGSDGYGYTDEAHYADGTSAGSAWLYHTHDGGPWTTAYDSSKDSLQNEPFSPNNYPVFGAHDKRIPGGEGTFVDAIAADPTKDCDAIIGGVVPVYAEGFNCGPLYGGHLDKPGEGPGFAFGAPGHEDIHAIAYGGVSGRMYAGTDGGLYRSDNSGEEWYPRNEFGTSTSSGAAIAYGAVFDDTTGFTAVATMDNGPLEVPFDGAAGVGYSAFGEGEDAWAAGMDAGDGDATYMTGLALSLNRFAPFVSGWTAEDVSPCPGGQCPGDPYFGTPPLSVLRGSIAIGSSVLHSSYRGQSWTTEGSLVGVPPVRTDCVEWDGSVTNLASGYDCYSALAADPNSNGQLPSLLAGSDAGAAMLRDGTTLGSVNCAGSKPTCLPSPTSNTKLPGVPWITAVALRSSGSVLEAWVAIGKKGGSKLWYNPDLRSPATSAWKAILPIGALPDEESGILVHALAVDDAGELYAATDFGVDVCGHCSGGAKVRPVWSTAADGLPQVAVSSLAFSSPQRDFLLASTLGRGSWRVLVGG